MAQHKFWRDLSATTKARYRREGVTPSAYNAWQRKTPVERAKLKAKYPDGSGPAAISKKSHDSKDRRASRWSTRRELEDYAINNIMAVLYPYETLKHQPNLPNVRRRVGHMTDNELLIAKTANRDTIRAMASTQIGYRPTDDEGIINPFWYG